MAQHDEGDSRSGAGSAEADGPEDLAAAETRVLSEEDAAALETRLADATDSDSQAPRVAPQDAQTVLADEDRTQLVEQPAPIDRPASAAEEAQLRQTVVQPATGSDESEAASRSVKPTRVIDPAAPPAARRSAGATGPAEDDEGNETRLVDADDKTSPPPVSSARPARPPARPTPGDNERGLTPGTVLFGEYEIVNVLGIGGMGEVYRARHRRLDEHRAIKVMHAELSNKKGASEFFYREAKALLAVRHPAVVHCHDLLSDDEGRVYLIMEMIEGIPLSKKMNDGPLSPDDVALLGARVSHGLAAAHRKGVIHRDVSPDNIVLPKGRVQEAKIIDFGIAKILQEGEGTIVDGFKGKLSYASPEQLGFFQGKIDGRSDFYSLGLVLAAAALGRPMPMGTSVMEAVDARRSLASLPDAIPVGLRSAIEPLLQLDPNNRPKYVDRLFVVPGGPEGSTDTGAYGGISSSAPAPSTATKPSRVGLFAGLGVASALLVGVGFYVAVGGEALRGGTGASTAAIADSPPAERLAPLAKPGAPPAVVPVSPGAGEVEQPAPPVEVAKPAPKPQVRRLSGSDVFRINGLLLNAKLALNDNRLMSPAGDNAYDRYREVLALDPRNAKAKTGLRQVATRYLSLADGAIAGGRIDQARDFIDRAKQADPATPGIRSAESRLPD